MDFNKNREALKKVVAKVLAENPQGIRRDNLWNFAAKKMGKSPRASDYGFAKMSQMFPLITNLYLEFKVGKEIFIKPRPTEISSDSSSDEEDYPSLAEGGRPVLKKTVSASSPARKKGKRSSKSSTTSSAASFLSFNVSDTIASMTPSKSSQEKYEELKFKIVKLLKKKGKILKAQLWGHFQREYNTTPRGDDYGVKKMADIIERMTDVLEERRIGDENYLLLRSTSSQPRSVPLWGQGAIPGPGIGRTSQSHIIFESSESDSDGCVIDEVKTREQERMLQGQMQQTNPRVSQGGSGIQSPMPPPLTIRPLMAQNVAFVSGRPMMMAPPVRSSMPFGQNIQYSLQQVLRLPGSQKEQNSSQKLHPDPFSSQSPGPSGSNRTRERSLSSDRQGPTKVLGESRKSSRLETKQLEVARVPYGRGPPSRDLLNNIAKDSIEQLSNINEHVSTERLEHLICQRFGVNRIPELQTVRYIDHIPAVNEHNRLLCKINMYIQAFVKARSLCTLYELSECLREFTKDREDFETLHCGPLQRFPVVYDLFKFPHDEEIPEITTLDVLEHLRDYLTKYSKWMERLEMEPVMEYMVSAYNMDTAYQLGVRIRSLPLAVQMLKKSQRDAAATRRSVTELFKDRFKKDLETGFQKFRASLLQSGDDGESEVRRHYTELRPETAILEIISKFQLLMSIDQPETKAEMRRHRQMEAAVTGFLATMRSDKLAAMLLHLAVCISDTTLQESAMELLAPQSPPQLGSSVSEENSKPRQPPSKGTIVDSLKKYIEKCLGQGAVTLSHLNRIEEKLLEDFAYTSFTMMGFGRFLDFLLHDPAAKSVLEEVGGSVLGSASSGTESESLYRPQMTDVLEMIRQCQAAGAKQIGVIEKALQEQFFVKEVRHLGYGNVDRLVAAADRPGKHRSSDYLVLYEAAIAGKTSCPGQGQSKVGILGHQSRDHALACLHNCPLLEDLAGWSNWSLVFESQHGKLKEFVQKYGGITTRNIDNGTRKVTTDIIALETQPGKLLKLVSQTSPDMFQHALSNMDVTGCCGHLVSMVMANKGIENTPMALLANQMKTGLFTMHASNQTPGGPPNMMDPAVLFVLECLVKLPLRICLAVANQLFLEPLGQVVGATKSKALLLSSCSEMRHQQQLERLGCLLGVQEWTHSLTAKYEPPKEAITEIYSAAEMKELEQEGEELVVDSESESSSVESDSSADDDDDLDSILSDIVPDEISDVKKETEPVKTDSEVEVDNETDEPKTRLQEDLDDSDMKESDSPVEIGKEEEEASESPMNKCQVIIEQIRREEFGIGVELNEDGQKLMLVQQERLGRSLDRLSKDLYSKDTHFVLELVQNADDNAYPEDIQSNKDECPAVLFKMDSDGITVFNNECGFEEKNVRALCDVGRSTKGKHKFGYIGQKGIGFKSVFRVTDSPEVHSNGFHLKFDVKSGPTGYILPHWVDTDADSQEGWTTCIFLPLKEAMVLQTRSLAARFNDIHPSLLLFLHRLRKITIENLIECNVTMMHRKDLEDGVIEIDHGTTVDRWLVVRKLLDASKISIQAKSGVDVESTEIALAFPLRGKDNKTRMHVLPTKQPVFAFLPLRSYGFRFIIQGDFDVPSSREDIDRDSPWNQWLRNELHSLFVESLDTFKSHPSFSSMDALITFLQFVPMEDEIMDFFRPVASQILAKLRAKEFLPVQTAKKGSLQLKIPSQTVIVRDQLIQEVISPEVLEKNLNLYYLHNEVAMTLTSSLAHSLGIESITVENLVQIGKSLVLSWETESVDISQKTLTISKWMACVYRSLDEFQQNESVYDNLKSMKIIPLSTGQIISLDEMTVFLPPVEGMPHGQGRDPLSHLHHDLNMIHVGLVTTPDNEVNSQVQKLLQRVGVKHLSPQDIIHHHILPALKSDACENKSRDVLISYLVFIKLQCEREPSLINMTELKSVARVVTNFGVKKPAEEAVHFTPAYGNKINLQAQLPGYDWVLLDAVYLNQATSAVDVLRWHEFFLQLGVTDFLSVTPVHVHLTKETMVLSPWAPLKDMWPDSSSGYHITDYKCEEFSALVDRNKFTDLQKLVPQLRILFEVLDRDWDGKYSKFRMVQVKDGNGQILRDVESSFSIALTSSKWVPALRLSLQDLPEGGMRMQEDVSVMQPLLLYKNDPKLKNLLFHMVYYLAVPASPQSLFISYLRVKTSVNSAVVKELLIECSARDEASSATPAVFKSCLAHLKEMYRYLYDQLPPKELQDLFHDNNVIFVPDASLPDHNDQIFLRGQMLGRQDVWWSDPSGLFNRYKDLLVEFHSPLAKRHSISPFYQDLEELFLRGSRIDLGPSLSHLADLMCLLTSVRLPNEHGVLSDVLSIFARIGKEALKVEQEKGSQSDILIRKTNVQAAAKKIAKQKIFPTKRDEWVNVDANPMVADQRELEKLFADQENVHFIQLEEPRTGLMRGRQRRGRDQPKHDLESIMAFLKLFKINPLSSCVRTEESTEMTQPCLKVQSYAHRIVPHIQCFLFCQYLEVYSQLVDSNIVANLKLLSFYQVGKLEVIYTLSNNTTARVIRSEKCMQSGRHFFFHKNHLDSFTDINREIAKYFSGGNDECFKLLRNFLGELNPILDDGESVADVYEKHELDMDEMREEEELWEIPPPFIPEPIVAPPIAQPDTTGDAHESKDVAVLEVEGGMRAWPPKASSSGLDLSNLAGKTTKISGHPGEGKMWPPPKPPEYHKQVRELPTNVKVIHSTEDKSAEQNRETKEATNIKTGETIIIKQGERPAPKDPKDITATTHQGSSGVKVIYEGERHLPQEVGQGHDAHVDGAGTVKRKLSDTVIEGDAKRLTAEDEDRSSAGATEETSISTSDEAKGQTTPGTKRRHLPSESEVTSSPKKPIFFKPGDPMWSDLAMEVEYEELMSGSSFPTPDLILQGDGDKLESPEIGRWGECLVRDYLNQKMATMEGIVSVKWMNEMQESGSPYDFEVMWLEKDGTEPKTFYIEVKSTILDEKRHFEISSHEINFSITHKEFYQIYRIFNAGKPEHVKLVRINNVATKMDQGKLKLYMYI